MRVIVIGAGVIGASIAWNLSRAGASVTVVQSGAAAASDHSFGWINASFYADAHHHRLRRASLEAYRRLRVACPDLPVAMHGALWFAEQGAGLDKLHADLAALEYEVSALSRAEAEALEPDVIAFPEGVLRFGGEGAAEVDGLARHLITASTVNMKSGVQVTDIVHENGKCVGVKTTGGLFEADHVVVAAGNGSPAILDSVGVALPMLVRPGALVSTKPVAAKINHILVTPHGEARQLPDGRMLASAVANHQGDESSEVADRPEEITERVLGWLSPMIRGGVSGVDRVDVAYRPVPQDGLPVIGAVGPKGLHVAVMHSGVTLAAIVGEVVAAEVLGQGGYDDLLAPYRPQRFQGG